MKKIKKNASDILKKYPVIRDNITIATGLTGERLELLFEEVVKYLHTCNESKYSISPSKIVDKAWHEFILHTQAYTEFCEKNFGRYIHHIPGRKPCSQNEYDNSKKCIEELFGSLDEEFWPEKASASCGCDGNPNCGDKPTM